MFPGPASAAALVAALAFLGVGVPAAYAANELCGQTVTESLTLTADQTCTGDGLIVGADGITIDLGGFTISGDGGNDEFGIVMNGHSVTIRNGVVRGFFNGITNDSFTEPAVVKVTGITARENVQFGASIFAGAVFVDKSAFIANGGVTGGGLSIGCDTGKVTSTAFVGNVGDGLGLVAASNVTVAKVVSAANTGRGGRATNGNGVTIQSSTFARNGLEGVSVEGFGATAKITKNTIIGNVGNGVTIDRMNDTTVTKNVITANGAGVSVQDSSQRVAVIGNRVLGNGSDGISVAVEPADTLVKGNVVVGNTDDGIDVESATTTVAKNAATANLSQGIDVAVAVIDGGGNTARANGHAEQCSPAVACAPPFAPKPGAVTPTCDMHVTSSIKLGADTPVCSTNGIVVDADNVTIDLNGHSVIGDGSPGTTGILVGDHDKVTIKNGVVFDFDIGIASSFGQGLKIQNVETRSNGLFGAALGGSGIVVTKSVFVLTDETGLFFFDATTAPKVSQSFFVANGHAGLVSRAPGTSLTKVTAATNGSSGIQLEGAGSGTVSGSFVAANGDHGISIDGTFAPAKLTKNVVIGNDVDGIGLATNGTGLTIASNLAGGNGQHGVHLGPSTTNAVTKNALLGNGSDGLLVEATAVSNQVTANAATGNGNRGIAVSTAASTLTKNVARANLAIGITAAPGTIDGGGNSARDNAGVAQCTDVVCD